MPPIETMTLVIGALFILLAVFGGGIVSKWFRLSRAPTVARIVLGVIGVAMCAFALWRLLQPHDQPSGPNSDLSVAPALPPPSEPVCPTMTPCLLLHQDATRRVSQARVELMEFSIKGLSRPPRKGSTLMVSYRIRNAGNEPIALEYTFVGVRDPGNFNRDTEGEHRNATLAPDEDLRGSASVPLDQEGTWKIWPCFAQNRNGEEVYCDDEWAAFPLAVVR